MGKNNKGTREYKKPTPVKLYIQLGRSTKVLGNIKLPPPLNLTFIEDLQWGFNSPTPVKLLHSLKIFNKGLILPTPLNFTFIEDLQ